MKTTLLAAVSAAMIAALGICAGDALAQNYPTKPVTIIVPSAPGGTTDIAARLVAEGLSKHYGKSFVVENKGGASGNIGITEASRARPDGYTLLLTYSGYQVNNPALFKSLAWDPIKSFVPVALVLKAPHVILVSKDLPVNTLQEFVAYAKSKNGSVTYASSGPGSIQHIGGEQLAQLTGIKMIHVPYKGAGPALTDLLAGSVNLFITTPPSAVGHISSGAVKGLAIAAPERHPLLPNVPTTAEAGVPGLELTAWFAMYAPAGTPKAIVDDLSAQIKTLVESEDFKAQAAKQGAYAVFLGADELGEFTQQELKVWGEVIRKANITLE
ncbi:tripartite tricarboxylate transporter substrate binding protein [Ancylobacter sp. WKF20]|uniref:Bug family tripartite tricarboxylate transporter substrate binding protein n=1 Tax=Ancylobacter sp. WKF20 TaxID=3039801 RepID=UPI0024343B83|nr:tripartite tricarboxylate transporter substrate binding protein [Ancylobacter sp. WKF20]WGD29656.1 tripartite tricarboxylate transporter substrate binding protein [Ancylobacter sp. WKF20]